MVKLGAHLSISKGYVGALEKIHAIGGNALQIFSTSPRGWHKANPTPDSIKLFIEVRKKLKIDPVFFHASYLINLGASGSIGHLSKESLIHELNLAPKLGIKGSIVHLGSFKNGENEATPEQFETLIQNIHKVLEHTPEQSLLLIENAGTRKIGRTLEEIGRIIKTANNNRLRVCLDTCHLHAAGYDLSSSTALNHFLNTLEKLIGLERLEAWHFNDSKDNLGSFRDRHENIGRGEIGKQSFRLIMKHPKLSHLPFIIETPGFDNEGPDKKNLDILKSLL